MLIIMGIMLIIMGIMLIIMGKVPKLGGFNFLQKYFFHGTLTYD
jgi:sulfite exporter TauE/SafE